MPLVGAPLLDRLIDAYDPDEGRLIVLPTSRGKRGNPVLWDRRFFADMTQLRGDVGARALLNTHAEAVAEVETNDDAILSDYDRPGALPLDPAGAWRPQTPTP
jgi:molybdenum cofactor cytidylyltransferase